jgi:hypothetical protein
MYLICDVFVVLHWTLYLVDRGEMWQFPSVGVYGMIIGRALMTGFESVS